MSSAVTLSIADQKFVKVIQKQLHKVFHKLMLASFPNGKIYFPISEFLDFVQKQNLESYVVWERRAPAADGTVALHLKLRFHAKKIYLVKGFPKTKADKIRIAVATTYIDTDVEPPTDFEDYKKLKWYPVVNDTFRASFTPQGNVKEYSKELFLELLQTQTLQINYEESDDATKLITELVKLYNQFLSRFSKSKPVARVKERGQVIRGDTLNHMSTLLGLNADTRLKDLLLMEEFPGVANLAANIIDQIAYASQRHDQSSEHFVSDSEYFFGFNSKVMSHAEVAKGLKDHFNVMGKPFDLAACFSELTEMIAPAKADDRTYEHMFSDTNTLYEDNPATYLKSYVAEVALTPEGEAMVEQDFNQEYETQLNCEGNDSSLDKDDDAVSHEVSQVADS